MGDAFVTAALLDFGGEVQVNPGDLRAYPEELKGVPPQAVDVTLGAIKTVWIDDGFDAAVLKYAWGLCDGVVLYLHVMSQDESELKVLLTDSDSVDAGSVNEMLVMEGLARVPDIELAEPFGAVLHQFKTIETRAREARKGIWRNAQATGFW
jgi:hypothetical protein